jgi:hypothetical protein
MEPTQPKINWLGNIIAGFAMILSFLYMLNFSTGLIEILPDNLPFVGNIDEAVAMGILFASLRWFGFDLLPFKNRCKDVVEKLKE